MASWWRQYVIDTLGGSGNSGSWKRRAAEILGAIGTSGPWPRRIVDGVATSPGSWTRNVVDSQRIRNSGPWASQLPQLDPPEPPFKVFSVMAGVDNQSGDSGYYRTVYGSISTEPLMDFPLLEFATRNEGYTQVAFEGDCTSMVAGWVPVIPGVTLGTVISDWVFDGSYTSSTWNSVGDMLQGQEYPITWVKG